MTRTADNNLDVLRLFAALLVLIGHSYIFLGRPERLFLGMTPLGPVGVYIFFIISGYLVTASWDRDPQLSRYFARRLLRIIPGLAVCIVLSIFVLGPLMTTLPLKTYFGQSTTYAYFSNVVLFITYYLPGVFATSRVPNAVNGSLWSLPVEFTMYIVVAILGVTRANRWVYLGVGVLSALACYFWAWQHDMYVVYRFDARQLFICGTFFWAGAIFFKFDLVRRLSTTAVALAFTALLFLEPFPPLLATLQWVLLPVVVLAFGFAFSPLLARLTATGDYSYGIYIYAFPIQQSVAYLLPGMPIGRYMLLCVALTFAAAILSWHLVEKRALAFKPRKSPRYADLGIPGAAAPAVERP
jgi:peptidoglycan/LPS O-acetylase OafA/YrhL